MAIDLISGVFFVAGPMLLLATLMLNGSLLWNKLPRLLAAVRFEGAGGQLVAVSPPGESNVVALQPRRAAVSSARPALRLAA